VNDLPGLTSMNPGPDSPSELRSWWQSPFDASTVGVVALFSGVILWNALFPGFYYMVFVFALVLFWGGLSTWILLRLAMAGIGTRRTGRPVRWNGVAGVLSLMCLVTVAVLTRLPLFAGFALARADLEETLVNDAEPGESFQLARSRAGIYGILQEAHRRCHHKDRIYITLSSDPEAGFVHSPDGVDDLCFNSGTTGHLAGDWYWMAED